MCVVVLVEFTDEEGYGRYLDLHESYERYINLKGVHRIDYITYLSTFDKMFDIPKEKKNAAYRDYLSNLIEYMEGYLGRIKPLLDQQEELAKVDHSVTHFDALSHTHIRSYSVTHCYSFSHIHIISYTTQSFTMIHLGALTHTVTQTLMNHSLTH